jgi:hypothetical protein
VAKAGLAAYLTINARLGTQAGPFAFNRLQSAVAALVCAPRGRLTNEGTRTMARKPTARTEYVLFNVYYEDGSQRSNRKVPAELLGGIDGDEPARKLVEDQDREISGKSGMPPLRIERIVRVDDDVKQQARDTRRANERRASR